MSNRENPPLASDPQLLTVGLERWLEAASSDPELAAFATAALEDARTRSLLKAILGNSPYLSQSLVREQPFVRHLLTVGYDAAFAQLLAELRQDYGDERDTAKLMRGLRLAKRRAALLIAMADIAGAWPLMQVTGALSDLAEACLQLACAHLLRNAARPGRLELAHPDDPCRDSGLIVLAMGKFGARELNYSSDIDLIVLYDDGIVRVPEDEMSRTFVRIARELVRIMEERTGDGYVFRTDLRLRPDPGATPLAVSVSAAEAYYGSLGQNWERAAMIKARPVAGDLKAGDGFMQIIRYFVWRSSLDFAAIQDIHSIKRQIGTHKGHREKTVNGHNIKIGRGGIREIEFFAQTQQLIYGGREFPLRAPATLDALDALVEAGRVERRVADELGECYRFLRTVEHRLQMVDDHQTHELPKTDEGVAKIAAFLGYADPQAFRDDLYGTLTRVEDHYARLFEEAPPLSGPGNLVFTGTENDPETLETLRSLGFQNPAVIAGQIRGWHHGRYRATRSTRARELLTELTPTLLETIGRTPNPDQAFLKFDEFLARLPAGVQLFSLFYANPNLLELVAEVMGTAPRLADILSNRPAELDAVLTPGFFGPLPDREELEASFAELIGTAQGFEETLNLARRWTNERRFRAGVHILRNITDADRCGPFLTELAEVALAGMQEAVEEEFAKRHGRFPGAGFAIVAMGRLGARSLSLRSDLDMITVYEVPEGLTMSDGDRPLSPNDYFIKLTQRLMNAITAPTAEGCLYEVDMRLRPSGNAGPLAVSFESFGKYQRENAWTWEHMALTRARVITGPIDLRWRLTETITDVLTAPREHERLLRDVASMRLRIDQQHRTADVWEVKHVRGGMVDIQFIAQYLMLRHAAERPEILEQNTTGALAWLGDTGLLELNVARELIEAMKLWRRVQGFIRLTTEGKFRAADAPAALKVGLVRACFPEEADKLSFEACESRLRAMAAAVYARFQEIVELPAAALPPVTGIAH
ncbi:bifunctional [glutamine synthetase] adenylyltransferase/[glutamine synthetase]-adenylyl-L-tyrosine phosphorylase [Indioceanicola profundi]|uniref:bifunctional [glutamine synthetase] adenylyltransferase/[glutamine synthetase]-adenylyl-L-tyrosine phosphorylase n=1 Tax=Indioceanicola profundi TaxID=2220096 RepID=UPI000E6A9E04|nr:bifunctional [glutamine synthetase] adenylyltransferase/[glutamine synthetase]-adenylyl-L-tyrosine phosphorylase [Indioceanicola profundi]